MWPDLCVWERERGGWGLVDYEWQLFLYHIICKVPEFLSTCKSYDLLMGLLCPLSQIQSFLPFFFLLFLISLSTLYTATLDTFLLSNRIVWSALKELAAWKDRQVSACLRATLDHFDLVLRATWARYSRAERQRPRHATSDSQYWTVCVCVCVCVYMCVCVCILSCWSSLTKLSPMFNIKDQQLGFLFFFFFIL